MSNIAANANRYNTSNTFRSDAAANTRGSARNSAGTAIGFDCSGLVYHVLRESGYNVPYAASSVMVDNKTFSGNWATPVKPDVAVQPGTLVYFNGHVGIVQSYDPVTKRGEFLSMTGSNNSGVLKPTEAFTTDDKINPNIHWGGTTAFKGFAEVKPELYDRTLDQHANGANPNAPVFNIPEASNAGFITLPGNGGFPAPKSARDLSADTAITAANTGIAPPPPIDLPNAATAFATALAALESNGQPNNGYGAWLKDGQGIGAIGRYGFRAPSLKAIGWMDSKGSWTDEARANGVDSPESFRNNPQAQEAARVEYMSKIKSELQANGAWAMIGKTVDGHVVTEAGLLAAAWKEGTGAVDKFFEGNSNNTNANTNILFRLDRFAQAALPAGGAADTPANPSIPAESPRTPYPSNSNTVHHVAGDTTVSYVARADSTDGSIRKGDLVTYVQDPDGKTTYFSVNHQEGKETTLLERVLDPVTGEVTITFSQWLGSGPGSLQFQSQWDAAGNRVGDYYVQGGETYARTADGAGTTRWLNDRGQTRQEWLADPENPHSANSVNGSDLQSDLDSGLPEQHVLSDFGKALIDAFENSRTSSGGAGTQYAEAGTGTDTATDAGAGGPPRLPPPEPNPYSYTNYLSGAGANLSPHQQTGLALQLDSLNLGGENVLSFITLPGGGATLIQNADGDIVGEINQLANGTHGSNGYARLSGVRINADGSAESYTAYVAPNGQALTPAQYDQARASEAASAIGLMNSIIGLQHWDNMGDLQRMAAIVSIYNVVDKLAGGAMPGELGGAAGVLGLLNALDQGNVGSALISGISVIDFLAEDMVSNAIGSALGIQAGNVVPGLGFVLALDSGDPVSIASSGLSLMSSLGYIGPWGAVAAVVIVLLGSLFEDDIPMKEGLAHAEWDAQGNTQVLTDQDLEGGGATATGWMNSIVAGLQAQLAATQDAADNSYALIPNLLPAIGYQYDPDGFNYGSASGHMYLKWTDAQGNGQTRYYDGQGNREDGTGETLASDFMEHAQGAIAPAWQVATVLAHWQQGQGIHLPDGQAGLPQELADGIHQSLQAFTLELPSPPALTNGLIDIDADGYLEKTQWLAANQQILAIDANGDGQIGAGELLSFSGGAALNSLNWLDTNNDQVLNASDPAFSALRLWMDINSDGNSQGETQTLNQASISAIDFGSNPPAVVRTDGSRTTLTAQTLTGHVLGVRYTATAGGVLEAQERGETVLHAVNTREFDGQSGHIQGGAPDTDGTAGGQAVLINAQDSRLGTTTARTLANRPVFVPIAATTQAQAQREATAAMVRSAESMLFGTTSGAAPLVALALGAGAMQWPVVQAANLPGDPAAGEAASTTGQPSDAQPSASFFTTASSLGPANSGLDAPANPVRVELSALQTGRVITGVQSTGDGGSPSSGVYASNQVLAQNGWPQAAIVSVANPDSSSAAAVLPSDAATSLSATLLGAPTTGEVQLTYPTVTGELIAGTEDIGLRIAAALLLANDSTLNAGDPSRPLLSISAVGGPTHGQVALRINEAGATEVVFIPEANYHGPASFVYTVTDQYGLSTVATATLDIASVNDAPTPVADAASGDEDATLMFTAASLLSNDFDRDSAVDGDVLRITRVGLAEHGQVFLQADGNIRFVPDLNYNGPAQFSYWVADRSEAAMATQYGGTVPGGVGLESPGTMHLTVLPVNDLPVVTGEAVASDEDVVLTIDPALLLANDSDVDTASNGQVLTISAVSGAQHGAVILLANGTIQFTPEQDYFGPASFVYTVEDGNGGQVQGTAVVNLASVNDVPVVNDELLIGKRDATYTLSQAALLANDTDLETPGGLSIVAVQGMSHGTAVLNANGSVTFTPEPGYSGRSRFEYVVQDADGGQAVAATEIDFAAINVNPIATDDSFTGFEDIAFVIQANQLLANDADPDASGLAALTVDAVRNASHGTVSLQADGSVRFDPVANFYGAASFEYRTNDGEGGQTWATAYLNVQSVNDAPVITGIWYASGDDSTFYMGESTLTSDDPYRQGGGIVAYDPDGDSAAITVSIGSGPQHGHAWANVVIPISAPSITHESAPNFFVPQAGAWTYFSHFGDPYSGSDPFTVSVTDSGGASTTAMIYAAHQGSSAGGGGKCPIVVDLNGDGIELIRPEDSDIFADVNGDGWRERIGWAADEDGVLTFDANRDGRITDNAEVSFVGYKEGARTDLDGLAAFDTDGDGKLNAGDAAWSQFGVLRDANGNGRQDEGELVSLDQLGVTGIGLQRQGSPRLDNGNVVFGTTDVTYADGRIGQAGDVMFAGENVPLPAAVQAVLPPLPPPTGEDEVARLALLMSQYGALAEGPSEPLGFVDWSQASPTQSPAEAMASALVQTDHFGTSPAGSA